MVSMTPACASCWSRANGSRCGSTRCTRAARTPWMARMVRASSPSSARVSLIFCWKSVGGEAVAAIEDFVADRAAGGQPLLRQHQARFRHLVGRHQDLAAAGADPVGDVVAAEQVDHLARRRAGRGRRTAAPSGRCVPRSVISASMPSMPMATAASAASRAGPSAFSPSSRAFIARTPVPNLFLARPRFDLCPASCRGGDLALVGLLGVNARQKLHLARDAGETPGIRPARCATGDEYRRGATAVLTRHVELRRHDVGLQREF